MPRRSDELFIYIPRKYETRYKILIDGTDRRTDVLEAKFKKSIAPEVGSFNIELDNNNGRYTDAFSVGDEVEFQHDFGSGTTTRFKGVIEEIKDEFVSGGGQKLEVVGSHVAGQLLDRTVIKSYDGTIEAGNIIKDLINNFAPSGFTTTNVESSTVFPKISFNAVPLWKAMSDVVKHVGTFDMYVDDDKNVHFFKEGSVKNDDFAVVLGYTLIELESLGKNTLKVRNKVRVYGEQEGLPVIYTAKNLESQGKYGVKEHVVKDNSVTSEDEAESLAEGLIKVTTDTFDVGGGTSLILSSISPGDFSFIASPIHKIKGRFRFVRFTHVIKAGSIETTEFEVEDVRS